MISRLDLDKGVAAVAERVGQHRDRVLDRFGVVPVAGLHGQQRQHRLARQVLQRDVDIDLAEPVALAFLDREGDDERRRDPGVSSATAETTRKSA